MISCSHWGLYRMDVIPSGYTVTFDFGGAEVWIDVIPPR